jgi:hypothetical protein
LILPEVHFDGFVIRKYDWFELFRDRLDDKDRKELDALVVRVNEHQASIAVADHPFSNYVMMQPFILEEHKDLKQQQRENAERVAV